MNTTSSSMSTFSSSTSVLDLPLLVLPISSPMSPTSPVSSTWEDLPLSPSLPSFLVQTDSASDIPDPIRHHTPSSYLPTFIPNFTTTAKTVQASRPLLPPTQLTELSSFHHPFPPPFSDPLKKISLSQDCFNLQCQNSLRELYLSKMKNNNYALDHTTMYQMHLTDSLKAKKIIKMSFKENPSPFEQGPFLPISSTSLRVETYSMSYAMDNPEGLTHKKKTPKRKIEQMTEMERPSKTKEPLTWELQIPQEIDDQLPEMVKKEQGRKNWNDKKKRWLIIAYILFHDKRNAYANKKYFKHFKPKIEKRISEAYRRLFKRINSENAIDSNIMKDSKIPKKIYPYLKKFKDDPPRNFLIHKTSIC